MSLAALYTFYAFSFLLLTSLPSRFSHLGQQQLESYSLTNFQGKYPFAYIFVQAPTSLTSTVYREQAWGGRRPANQGESTDVTFTSIPLQIPPT